jgi:hypothetical protein
MLCFKNRYFAPIKTKYFENTRPIHAECPLSIGNEKGFEAPWAAFYYAGTW